MLHSSLRRNRNAGSSRSRAEPRRRPYARLYLEPLEERLAPATSVWDGGSTLNSNWSTAANWVGDVAPVPGVDDLQFPATAARKASTNDFVGAAFLGIAFTGSNYVLGGNALTLGGNLTAGPGAISDYLNLPLTLDADRTFQLGASSVLTANGVLGGPGGFIKAGTGTLMLHGANTYAGRTQVSEGSLYV
jgi:autotransporter-associated beta strand protein